MAINLNSSSNPVTPLQSDLHKSLRCLNRNIRENVRFSTALCAATTQTHFASHSFWWMNQAFLYCPSPSYNAMSFLRWRQIHLLLTKKQLPNCIITCITGQKSPPSLERHSATHETFPLLWVTLPHMLVGEVQLRQLDSFFVDFG